MKSRLRLFVRNFGLAIAVATLFAACGQPVPQNKLALVIKTMGERTTNAAETSEIYWGRRLPAFITMDPSVRHFTFPLGLQDYEFSSRASFESPTSNAIEVDCLGGHLSFDVNMQLEIDRSLLGSDDKDLAAQLLAFISDHQLKSYSGEGDILAKWAGQKLRQFVREPLTQYCLPKQAIDIMRNKMEMNKLLMERMNLRFNKYGIKFTSIGVTSAIHLPEDQKTKMADVLMKEYANRALELRDTRITPLKKAIVIVEQNGLTLAQNARNEGITQPLNILAAAQQERRQMFIRLVGPENYVTLEQMFTMTEALSTGGTKITIIPSSLMYMGNSAHGETKITTTK